MLNFDGSHRAAAPCAIVSPCTRPGGGATAAYIERQVAVSVVDTVDGAVAPIISIRNGAAGRRTVHNTRALQPSQLLSRPGPLTRSPDLDSASLWQKLTPAQQSMYHVEGGLYPTDWVISRSLRCFSGSDLTPSAWQIHPGLISLPSNSHQLPSAQGPLT
jgi:hypothetical protein